jgi:predicted permease
MSLFSNIFAQVLVLFILMSIGFLSCKLGATKDTQAFLSSFVLKITLPCLILHSFRRPFSRELMGEAAIAFGLSIIAYGICILIAFVYTHLFRIRGPERGVHRYALIVPNAGFIGYPVVETIMGSFFLFHAVFYNMINVLLAFSVAAWLIAKEGSRAMRFSWRFFLSPPFIATIAGFFMFLFSIPLPVPIERSIGMLAGMTTPLSMAVIGISIAWADKKKMFGRWKVYVTVFIKLLLIPALIAFVFYMMGIRGPLLMIAVIIIGMPAGSTTSILASVYNVAEEEAGSIVILSTVLSAVTIPLTVIVLQYICR